MEAELSDIASMDVDIKTGSRRSRDGRVRMTRDNVSFHYGKVHQPLLGDSDETDNKSAESSDEELPNGTEIGASKPLMHPRQKAKVVVSRPRRRSFYRLLTPLFFIFLLIFFILALALGLVYRFKIIRRVVLNSTAENVVRTDLPCSSLNVSDVWVVGFPKLESESAIRMVDVNSDGVLDVIFGFATGADGYAVPEFVCDVYFQSQKPCLGGVVALNGATGTTLWKHNTPHEIFSLNCNVDLNADNIHDCVVAGRAATMEAVSGKDGSVLWSFGSSKSDARNDKLNVYVGQFVYDLDSDSVADLVVAHGGISFVEADSDSKSDTVGRLMVVSGRTGVVLQWADVPDGAVTHFSSILYERPDGVHTVLFGTGNQTQPGALWAIELSDLHLGDMTKAIAVYSNINKGIITPPALVDITGDGVLDIVLADLTSTVAAIDGNTLTQLWNFTFQSPAEFYAAPASGFYNNDSVPDFMVTFQNDRETMVTVLDGRTGQPILQPYITSSGMTHGTAVTLSMLGTGRDMFLYTIADCLGHEGGLSSDSQKQSGPEFCWEQFQSRTYNRLMALNQFTSRPGFTVYNSELRADVEKSAWVNTSVEAQTFLEQHLQFEHDWLSNSEPEQLPSKPRQKSHHRRPLPNYMHERSASSEVNVNREVRRRKRYSTPDSDDVQRFVSTVSLAPPVLATDHADAGSMDVMLVTYWKYSTPKAAEGGLTSEDRDCINQRLANQAERFNPASIYYLMSNAEYEHAVTSECLQQSGHLSEDGLPYEQTDTTAAYNPFNLPMGQLTVYRLRLTCQCDSSQTSLVQSKCGQFLPYNQQH